MLHPPPKSRLTAKIGWDILRNNIVPSAVFDSDELYDAPKCHPETRKAILKQIISWIEDRMTHTSFIMWMYGPAGAGKSAIAKTIAEMCAKVGLLAASFFFSRAASGRNVKTSLISTLAYQICLSIPEIRATVIEIVAKDPTIFSRSLVTQITKLIVEPLQSTLSNQNISQANVAKFIVIDGLDECDSAQAQLEILDALTSFTSACSFPLLFLVASRPEYDIREAFNANPLRLITTTLPLDDNYRTNDDISTFITSRFEDIKRTHPAKNRIPDSWPARQDLRALVDKASGLFIYASTVMKFIESRRHLPPKRLDIILGTSSRGPNDTPFAQLDAMYHYIFSQIPNSNIQPILDLISLLILSISPRPHGVTLAFAGDFFGYETGYLDIILSELHSILSIPAPGHPFNPICLYHKSLGDFLLDLSRSKEFCIDTERSHAKLAILWIRYGKRQRNGPVLESGTLSVLRHCSSALPTTELVAELKIWDLKEGLSYEHYEASFNLLPPFFDWLESVFSCVHLQAVFYRMLEDLEHYIRRMTRWSKETRRLIQAIIIADADLFKNCGSDFFLILCIFPERGSIFSSPLYHMMAMVFSRSERAPYYPVDGRVYAELTRKVAEYMFSPCLNYEMKKNGARLMIRILPKADTDPWLGDYLRDLLFPVPGDEFIACFQQALRTYMTRCNVPVRPNTP
ncbi:hypothetical protein M413DRAFT_31332 [Hebeloma cylindrosporum]|uniref:Nephrocystin 3-like N-terminal domain-containing protein n=1 Tax=Hebeloma cylindrosporum TaxID=76867 RepID=A0A0C3BZS1_HEBCY|nr:hypothetical protein M413DRAFT_31332 [Hebeloma cylindrosporum h7]